MPFPTPHQDKLRALLGNDKLPNSDRPRVRQALEEYERWIERLEGVLGDPSERLKAMVELLNEYRLWLDLDFIFDSQESFLYRQKGQLKLDNSVIEEFLPRLITSAVVPEMAGFDVRVGPTNCFSALYFESSLETPQVGGGLTIRSKAQDFAISKRLYLKAAHDADFKESVTCDTFVAYIVAECKTNLDKTMFQEAAATAHDVKSAVVGAHYFLLAEWLDMTPVSTTATDIDEVLILRKARRLGSSVRQAYAETANRRARRAEYKEFLRGAPLQVDMFERIVTHVRSLVKSDVPVEGDVLARGYF